MSFFFALFALLVTYEYLFKSKDFKTHNLFINLTFRGPCIVIYSYNKSQRDALFLELIFDKELYMFRIDLLSIIRSLNTVHHVHINSYLSC